jgi:hypothetical protein
MNEKDLRDCFAMFAMLGLITRGETWHPRDVWEVADAMIETRNVEPKEEQGIVAIKKKIRKV